MPRAPYILAQPDVYIGVLMAKTLIDLDEALLAEATAVLGTRTKKDTVHRALADAVASARRREHLELLMRGGLPDLGDPEVMGGAWR